MEKDMVKVLKFGMMEVSIKESLKMTWKMDMENIDYLTVQNIQEIFIKINFKEKVLSNG